MNTIAERAGLAGEFLKLQAALIALQIRQLAELVKRL